jgi:hypothetical protein
MSVLLDACLPERLRFDLASAGTVHSARYAGLQLLSNGALLAAMAGRYDVLVTCDQSIRYQNVVTGVLSQSSSCVHPPIASVTFDRSFLQFCPRSQPSNPAPSSKFE